MKITSVPEKLPMKQKAGIFVRAVLYKMCTPKKIMCNPKNIVCNPKNIMCNPKNIVLGRNLCRLHYQSFKKESFLKRVISSS